VENFLTSFKMKVLLIKCCGCKYRDYMILFTLVTNGSSVLEGLCKSASRYLGWKDPLSHWMLSCHKRRNRVIFMELLQFILCLLPQQQTFRSCWSRRFYGLDALPVTHPVMKHLRV